MEVVDFWKEFKAPKVIQSYRNCQKIRSIPLYETNLYGEYLNKCADIIEYSVESEKVISALSYLPKGFAGATHNLDKCKVVFEDFTTYTFNIRACYQYFTYQELTGKLINNYDNIVEVGGGCGDFCRFIHNMGFTGTYYIVDLPETMKIQEYELDDLDVRYSTDIPMTGQNTLFISTWGLSETPMNTRPANLNIFEGGLVTYQRNIFNEDNEAYFNKVQGASTIEMYWLSWDGGSVFLSW